MLNALLLVIFVICVFDILVEAVDEAARAG